MTITHVSRPLAAARIAGAAYVAVFVLAIGANFLVRTPLVVADDPAATMANIAGSETAFRLGAAAFAVIAILDIIIAWALHVRLRPTGELRSLLAAWLRLGYGVMLAVAVGFMLLALELATDTERLGGLDEAARASLTGLAMDGFDIIWLLGLAVFGLHLIVIGRMLVSAAIGPRALGVLLGAAGIAYVADTAAHIVVPHYASIAGVMLAVVAPLSMVAEMWFAGWLLVRGARAEAPADTDYSLQRQNG